MSGQGKNFKNFFHYFSGSSKEGDQTSLSLIYGSKAEPNGSVGRWIKNPKLWGALATIAAFVIAFYQYVENTYIGRLDRAENYFAAAVSGLSSESPAVRAESVRRLRTISLAKAPNETESGLSGIPLMFNFWWDGPEQRPLLARGRNVFVDFLRSDRRGVNAQELRLVSTAAGLAALNWVAAEKRVGGDPTKYQFMLQNAKLPHAILNSRKIDGLYLEDVDLSSASLKYVNARNTNFTGSNFTQADMQSMNGEHVNFNKANFEGVKAEFFSCHSCSFKGSQITNVLFSAEKITSSHFDDAEIVRTTFKEMDLSGTSFRGATITGSSFPYSDMTNVDFTGSRLDGVDLSYARNLDRAIGLKEAVRIKIRLPDNFIIQ